jgi:hypothetical protein
MAAWTESQRAQIRHALGFGGLFIQLFPMLENAMTSLLATADGGSRDDDSTQQQVIGWLADIASLETKMKGLWDALITNKVDGDTELDAARAIYMMRNEGRRLVNYIASALATYPKRDIFARSQPNVNDLPYDVTGQGY